jgi:5-methylcytosine-specific restriction protein A
MSRTRGDLGSNAWKLLRKRVLDRDGHECQIAGPRCTGTATEVDHIIPHIAGGDMDMSNLRGACKPCNSALGARQRPQRAFSGRPLTDRKSVV